MKGDSAEKIYGEKGENGVVEIETKTNPSRGSKRIVLKERESPVDEVIEVTDGNLYFNTVRSEDQPLFVVNDKVVEGPLDLEPDDIESVTVLKGKSAKKLYGEEGKNGVVRIKTKNKRTKVRIKEKEKAKDSKGANHDSFRVLIDAGHGGADNGAVSPSGTLEKDISLAIAKLIKQNFSNSESIEILLSRDEDVSLELGERVSGSKNADLMIALHTDNYENREVSFVVPIYNDLHAESERSKRLANLLAQEFVKTGKEARVGYSSGYHLLKNAHCPAVLLNVGWFSKTEEDVYLSSKSGQQEVARSIANAIELASL